MATAAPTTNQQDTRTGRVIQITGPVVDVAVGEPLLYIDSRGRVGIAVNEGNYAKKFGVEPPATLFILRKGPPPRVKKEPVSR